MWICGECGREFKRVNQGHFCGKAPESIDEYISSQPQTAQRCLLQVRAAIRSALPEARERISWGMPTYWASHNIIQFAGNKTHVGLYAGEAAVREFAERLKEYKTSKGSIRLPYEHTMPVEIIADIARWCFETGNHP